MIVFNRLSATVRAVAKLWMRQLPKLDCPAYFANSLDADFSNVLTARIAVRRRGMMRGLTQAHNAQLAFLSRAHTAFPYMPSYVTGDLFTISSTCLCRGRRSPRRHEAAVLSDTPKILPALSSPTCSMNCFRFIFAVIHGLCSTRKRFLHTKLNAAFNGRG